MQAESQLLRGLLDDVFGLELLQLGEWGASRELLSVSRTRRQTVIGETLGSCVDVLAQLDALPIQTASVDAVLMPHTLELHSDPQAVLREADRVLTGEGQLIILGFKPFSLWGMRQAWSPEGHPPGIRQLLSVWRLRDWLGLLGYEVVLERQFLHALPWREQSTRPRRILRRGLLNPLPAAAYLLRARKHVYRLTPLRGRWFRERRRYFGHLPAPTTRDRT